MAGARMTELWHDVDQRAARVQLDRFSATIDPAKPALGLCEVQIDGRALEAFHPLGVELPAIDPGVAAQSIERYVRSGDLIVTYADQPAPGMRSQVYWRAEAHARHGAIATIALVVSVETRLLDSFPTLSVRSQLVASEAFQLCDAASGSFTSLVPKADVAAPDEAGDLPHCYLFRLPGRAYSYAEMVHPGDQRETHWDGRSHGTDYRLELHHELFARGLEKGVILRARVLGVLLDREDDKAAAIAHWASFLREEPPLTV